MATKTLNVAEHTSELSDRTIEFISIVFEAASDGWDRNDLVTMVMAFAAYLPALALLPEVKTEHDAAPHLVFASAAAGLAELNALASGEHRGELSVAGAEEMDQEREDALDLAADIIADALDME